LKNNDVPIIGTPPESIDLAEDRRRFGRLLDELRIPQPRNGTALVPDEAARLAKEVGLPVLVRPSYVLGGRAMVIAYDLQTVKDYVARAALMGPARPVLIDQFLEEATEVDVNPRASRTVPYVSKATGVPLAKVAARLMTGRKLSSMNLPVIESDGVAELCVRKYHAVKSPVFPFSKFRGVDTILGPEMRS